MKRFTAIILVVLAAACFAHRSGGQGTDYVPLEVFTNGPGRISPLHAGQMLGVWETNRMEAIPEPGFAFYSWESVDVFTQITRVTNGSGVFSTNIQKSVSSRKQFLTRPELIFIVRPIFVIVHSDELTTVSAYGWRANFGPVREPVEPDSYQTLPGASVVESGDSVTNRTQVAPISATLAFDLGADPPSLTAVIADAVLEGRAPFPLTVRSSYGYRLSNGEYRFSGDYLREIYPTGTQYLFDWRFSPSTNGAVEWNGITGWAGGHVWYVTISNLTLVPLAHLSISRVATASVQISWATNVSDYVLQCATNLPTSGWSMVTNQVTTNSNRRFVTVETDTSERFYRLYKPDL